MATSAKYFVFNPNGVYINWSYTTIEGFNVFGRGVELVGGGGDDRLFVGAGTSAIASGLLGSSGNDLLFLTGNFSEYSQAVDGNTYTFTRTQGLSVGQTEVIKFSVGFQNDAIYFSDGHIVLNGSGVQPNGQGFIYDPDADSFRSLSQLDLLSGGTPLDITAGLTAQSNQPTKVFVFDPQGLDIPQLPIAGGALVIAGGTGVDRYYVKQATTTDAAGLLGSAGADSLYLTGKFSDYTQALDGNTYTFTRVSGLSAGQSEVVKFSVGFQNDTIYFSDGHIVLNGSGYQPNSQLPIYDADADSFRVLSALDLLEGASPGLNKIPTGTVTITGTPTQGQTLTASNTLADADGPSTLTVSYQWKANGSPISGATNSTYTLTEAEVGKTITVAASYIDGKNKTESVSSAATTVIANLNDAPAGSITISGTPTQGQTLTVVDTVTDADGKGTVTYSWYADAGTTAIATGSSLLLTQAHVGKALSVKATYTDGHNTPETVASTATVAVANIDDAATGTLSVTGTPQEGGTLTASVASLADADGSPNLSYQWQLKDGANWVDMQAPGAALAIPSDQSLVGKVVRMVATSTDALGGKTLFTGSEYTIANVNDTPVGDVSIAGTAKVGEVLTASDTLTDGDGMGTVTYQWYAGSTAITGATGETFTLGDSQLGQAISVKASYTDAAGTPEFKTSAATFAVAASTLESTVVVTNGANYANSVGSVTYVIDAGAVMSATISGFSTGDKLQIKNAITNTEAAVTWTGGTVLVLTIGNAVITLPDAATSAFVQAAYTDNALNEADFLAAFGNDAIDYSATSDTTAPTISSIVLSATGAQNGTLNAGDVVTATVTLSESVVVSGSPQLGVTIGSTPKQATYVSGSGSNVLKFAYTVQAGDTDTNGVAIAANALSLNSGTIKDIANNDLSLTHSAVSDVATLKVDTTAPVFTSTASASIAENAGFDQTVYTAVVSGETSVSYSLKSVDDAALFNIDSSSGVVTLKANPNYEAKSSYAFTVVAKDDAGNTRDQAVVLNVTDVNEAPSAVVLSNIISTLAENISTVSHIKVADIAVTDDALGTNTISLTGTDASHFEVVGNALYVKSGEALNYEAKQNYAVTVSVADAGLTGSSPVTANYTLALTNVQEAPTGSVTISGTVTQGQVLTAGNTLVDSDGKGTVSYQWLADGAVISGATASTFTLTKAQVGKAITVAATYIDGLGKTESVTSNPTANVVNLNDAPTGTVTISGTATQGQTLTAANTLVDADGMGTVSYQWQADGSNISGATSSTLVLAEAQVGKAITVVASYTDGHGTNEAMPSAATAVAANVNDAPIGAVTISGTPTQGQTLSATNTLADADGIPTSGASAIAYQWRADGTNINGATGSTLVLSQAEVGKTISVVATYTDNHGTQETKVSTATLAVANVNDAPLITSGSTGSVAENAAISTVVYTAAATDVDAGETRTYSLSGTDAGLFDINATSGVVTLKASANYEVKPSYSINVVATDAAGLTATQAVTVSVTNVNEVPTVSTAIPDQNASSGSAFSYVVPANIFTDVDAGTTLSYSATKSDGTALPSWLSFNASTRTFSGTPASGDAGTVSVKVIASDGSLSTNDTFDIVVGAGAATVVAAANTVTVVNGGTYSATSGADVFVIDASQTSSATIVGFAAGDTIEVINGSAYAGINVVDQGYAGVFQVAAGNTTINMTGVASKPVATEAGFTAAYGVNSIKYDLSQVEAITLYEINQLRHAPETWATMLGLSLTGNGTLTSAQVAAKDSLVANQDLMEAALGHSSYMMGTGSFSHNETVTTNSNYTGAAFSDRESAAGYTWSAGGENISYAGAAASAEGTAIAAVKQYFVDAGVASLGHRANLLSASYADVGVGYVTGAYGYAGGYNVDLNTQDFGANSTENPHLTGFALGNTDGNYQFNNGEGLAGVAITITDVTDNKQYTTLTQAYGYWDFEGLGGHTYNISASGSGFTGTGSVTGVTLDTGGTNGYNSKSVDFFSGTSWGRVDFGVATNHAATGSLAITGTQKVGNVLTADTSGIADVDGVGAFNFQWYVDGHAIQGKTASTLTLNDALAMYTHLAIAGSGSSGDTAANWVAGHTFTVSASYTDQKGVLEAFPLATTGVIVA